ncbi:MAG: YitT family protein [Thermodesulfobacteriota bacterium]
MKPKKGPQPLYTTPKQLLLDLLYISAGSVLCAVAINGILIPHQFVTGGVTGLALLIHHFIPSLNAGWIYFILNLPLFALAWMAVGRRFFFYSILGAVCLTLAMASIHLPIVIEDKMLDALLAGLLIGAGVGITLKSSGSQGGTDILSVMLLKRFSISIGSTVLCVNVILLLMVAFLYSLESVLYTLVVLYVSARMVSLVVTGLSQRKAVFIISSHWEEIAGEILKDIRRGVTILEGEGGYTRQQEHILYTVVNFRDIGRLKRLIQQIDENAFVVISDTLEVVNYRIGNQPHW